MTAVVILFLILFGVIYAVRYFMSRPDLMARGLMWILTRRQRKAQQAYDRSAGRTDTSSRRTGTTSRAQARANRRRKEPIIPPEYAQDVEYVEVKVTRRVVETVNIRTENQVSDADWVDISRR